MVTYQKISKFMLNELLVEANRINKKVKNKIKYFNKSTNSRVNPVTKYDKQIELRLIKLLKKKFPQHKIFGEEFGKSGPKSIYEWIIDPIDGTKALICGQPTWSNLIGFSRSKKPILGLANYPVMKKYYFTDGLKSFCFDKKKIKIKTSSIKTIKNSKLIINSIHTLVSSKMFKFLKNYKYFFKISGSDSYNFCLLAEGKIDIVMEYGLKPYDYLPVIPIIENSGGIITDWQGKRDFKNGDIIASANKTLHSDFLRLINKKT